MSYTQSACGAHSGCGTEWGDYSCCVADNGCTTADCRSANCGTEWTAYGTCSDEETSCFTNYSKGAYNVCFK
ncbi:MAG: hypothetical protein KC416_07945 [Myxococcales bacterium]|nr:hypothetical protein [Myxococcales bacterium]